MAFNIGASGLLLRVYQAVILDPPQTVRVCRSANRARRSPTSSTISIPSTPAGRQTSGQRVEPAVVPSA
jgi:hypothetical protein